MLFCYLFIFGVFCLSFLFNQEKGYICFITVLLVTRALPGT